MKFNERHQAIYDARKQGKTFKEIGKQFGISDGRANQLYRMARHHIEDGYEFELNNSEIRTKLFALLDDVYELRHVMPILHHHVSTDDLQTLAKAYNLV